VLEPRQISFRSQQDFRKQLVESLLAIGSASKVCPKQSIGKISQGANQVPVQSHKLVKIVKRGECVSCKGLRYRDRPKKRLVLSEITAN
jgi:hypothetical protein